MWHLAQVATGLRIGMKLYTHRPMCVQILSLWQNHLRNEEFITSRSVEWFSTKKECSKHTYEAYKTMIKVEIKLLQLWFKDLIEKC
jgi:hypothetical protein